MVIYRTIKDQKLIIKGKNVEKSIFGIWVEFLRKWKNVRKRIFGIWVAAN